MKKITLILVFTSIVAVTNAQTKIIAHRGFSSIAPENTLLAFRKAIEVGADYFELDVQRSKDNKAMVIHDASIDKTSSDNQTGEVVQMNSAALKNIKVGYSKKFGDKYADEKMPTLKEALEVARGKIKVCIEIKSYGLEQEVLDAVNELEMNDQVIIFSFYYPVLAKIRQLDKKIPILYLISEADEMTVDYAKVIDAKAIGVGSRTDLTKEYIDFAHQQGVEVWQWTVNDEEKMESLMDIGLDGLITDYPDKALALRK
ncbi:MAG: glycerophosphodiester phosphodiesterase family protein [Cyclobacteriaceae bacterium]